MKFLARLAGDGHSATLRRMLQLTVTTPLPHEAPAISPQSPQHIPDLHSVSRIPPAQPI